MNIKGAANLIALGIVAIVSTGAVAVLRVVEANRIQSIQVSALEQGVNHIDRRLSERLSQLPGGVEVTPNQEQLSLQSEFIEDQASFSRPVTKSDGLAEEVEADSYLAISLEQDNAVLNDLICQYVHSEIGRLTNEMAGGPMDLEGALLNLLEAETTRLREQAAVGGYASTKDATRAGVADAGIRIAITLAISDVRNSYKAGDTVPTVRFCTPQVWDAIAANTNLQIQIREGRSARRREVNRALQRSRVATDGP